MGEKRVLLTLQTLTRSSLKHKLSEVLWKYYELGCVKCVVSEAAHTRDISSRLSPTRQEQNASDLSS